jgi:hypothetical protein
MEPEEAVALAQALLQKRIAEREDNFLRLAERTIFQYSRSPYLPLLAAKRIAFSDLKSWVSKYGLEASLADAGTRWSLFHGGRVQGKSAGSAQGNHALSETKNPFFEFSVGYAVTHAAGGGGWVDPRGHRLTLRNDFRSGRTFSDERQRPCLNRKSRTGEIGFGSSGSVTQRGELVTKINSFLQGGGWFVGDAAHA